MTQEIVDIIIIGGGPVGLFTAFYAGLRQASVKIIESLPELGGQPWMLYPEKKIYDIPAFPEIQAGALIENLLAQLERFPSTQYCLEEEALELNKTEFGYEVITSKQTHLAKTVIIACGNGAFRPRKLEIDEASHYEGKNLHYFVNNLERFRDHTVAICGGGDSAVDWALALEPIAKKVSIIHRRPQFRAQEHSVKQLEESSVEILTPYLPEQIIGNGEKIQSVVLKHAKGEDQIEIPVDDFIVNYGFSSSIGGMKNWGFEVQRNCIVTNSQMETTLPGVFAVGDIATYDGKVKIIATGFGEAPVAINAAMTYVNPNSRPSTIHSSSMF